MRYFSGRLIQAGLLLLGASILTFLFSGLTLILEQTLHQAMATLRSQCRRLVELLFLENPPRQYTEVAAELGPTIGSIGFTPQKCRERLPQSLHDLGFH